MNLLRIQLFLHFYFAQVKPFTRGRITQEIDCRFQRERQLRTHGHSPPTHVQQRQAVGVQEQAGTPPSLGALAPDFAVSVVVVFHIAAKRMASVSQVCADLVSATGDRSNFQQREMMHVIC